jgi:molybdopterin molybdotransferase
MLSYQTAYDLILTEISTLFSNWHKENIEYASISESLGRFIANDLLADIDQPSFDASAMDGIAVRYDPEIIKWKIISEAKAGISKIVQLNENDCAVIMTGAEIPENADTVIPIELLDISNNIANLKPDAKIKKGDNIRFQGENLKSGQLSVSAFTCIKPANISSITASGFKNIPLIKKPKIGIFSTGEELIEPDCKPERGQVRATNLYAVEALCNDNGFVPNPYGLIPDEIEKIKSAMLQSISENDIIITTGGASVGKFDFIKQVLNELNANIHFIHSNIKPGKPMIFATITIDKRKVPVFCLPGNPVSSFVNFTIYIKPILRKVFFQSNAVSFISAILDTDLKKKDNKTHFVLGKIIYDSAKVYFIPQGSNSSADMKSLSESDALGILPEETKFLNEGELISCMNL